MILVDTSIWIDHIRSSDPKLSDLLAEDRVAIHPFVIGEIGLGSIASRMQVLLALEKLPASTVAFESEVLSFIERYGLQGSGIGYVDAHLLVSTRLADGGSLLTRDRRLRAVAERLGIATDLSSLP